MKESEKKEKRKRNKVFFEKKGNQNFGKSKKKGQKTTEIIKVQTSQ